MRVFVTGATGFIGAAVVRALAQAGHKVTGLVRSEAKEAELRALGGTPHRGTLAEPQSYAEVASQHDAVVHTAVDYGEGGVALDRSAVETLLNRARVGSVKSVVYTSGVWVLGHAPRGVDEDVALTDPFPGVAWRPAHEKLVLAAARNTLHTAVIRPGLVYGGMGSLTAPLFESAVKEGATRFVGNGQNHWPMIHRDDLGKLYNAVLEHAASGVFHGVDGAALTLAEVATAASEAAGAGGKTLSVSLEEARKQMGGLADALVQDQVVRAPRSLALGWKPERASFAAAAREAFAEWKQANGIR